MILLVELLSAHGRRRAPVYLPADRTSSTYPIVVNSLPVIQAETGSDEQSKALKMRKRSAITICATTAACASTIPSSATAFFVAPPTVTTSTPRGLSLQSSSHGTTRKNPFHPRSTLRYKAAKEGSALVGFRRSRPRSHATRTSMAFGGGGGGRGPKTPFGLSSGTLVTIGFALLVFFAPGVVFGAFNTLFLVVTVGPLLFSLGINLYNKVNLTDAPCPVCGVQLQGLKNRENQCPSCGTMLMAQAGKFEALGSGYVRDETGAQQEFTRVGDNGVIDVDAIDVDD